MALSGSKLFLERRRHPQGAASWLRKEHASVQVLPNEILCDLRVDAEIEVHADTGSMPE